MKYKISRQAANDIEEIIRILHQRMNIEKHIS